MLASWPRHAAHLPEFSVQRLLLGSSDQGFSVSASYCAAMNVFTVFVVGSILPWKTRENAVKNREMPWMIHTVPFCVFLISFIQFLGSKCCWNAVKYIVTLSPQLQPLSSLHRALAQAPDLTISVLLQDCHLVCKLGFETMRLMFRYYCFNIWVSGFIFLISMFRAYCWWHLAWWTCWTR